MRQCRAVVGDLARQGEPDALALGVVDDVAQRSGEQAEPERLAHRHRVQRDGAHQRVVNALLDHFVELVDRVHGSGAEIIGHGRTSSEMQNDMWEQDEAHLIREATDAIAAKSGKPPAGWLGPGFGETRVTLDLLKEAGYSYVLDWPADDQPFWMATRAGPLLSVPYPVELNDVTALLHRRHAGREFADMIVNQFETMLAQSEKQPLVFALGLHAYVAGQPFRLHAIRKALQHCLAHRDAEERVWPAHPGAIARHCMQLPAGIVPRA